MEIFLVFKNPILWLNITIANVIDGGHELWQKLLNQ